MSNKSNMIISKPHLLSRKKSPKKPEDSTFSKYVNQFKSGWVKETPYSKASLNKVNQTQKIDSLEEFKKAKRENLTSIDVFMENISFFRKRQNLDVFTYLLSRLHTNENHIFDGLKTIAVGALGDKKKYKTVGRILKKIEGMGLLRSYLDQSFFKKRLVYHKKKFGRYFDTEQERHYRVLYSKQASRHYKFSVVARVKGIMHTIEPIEMLMILHSIIGVKVVHSRKRIMTVINLLSNLKQPSRLTSIYNIKEVNTLLAKGPFKYILEHAKKPFKAGDEVADIYYSQMYKEALNCLYKVYLTRGKRFLKYHLYKMKKHAEKKKLNFKDSNHLYAYLSSAIFNMIITDNKRRRKFAIKRAKELEPVPI